jgi:hypothetical protein
VNFVGDIESVAVTVTAVLSVSMWVTTLAPVRATTEAPT